MREEPNAAVDAGSEREGPKRSRGDMDRKFKVAMVLYAVLAVLSWFTLDGKIPIGGRLVELRIVPLLIIGAFVLRTMVAMKAEKVRREEEKGSS